MSVAALEARDPGRCRRVALVGSAPAFRRGLAAALGERGLAVDEPADLEAVPEGCGVVLITVRGPHELGPVAGISRRAPVVALMADASLACQCEALRLGASAAVAEDESVEEIVDVALAAAQGRTRMPTDVARSLATGLGAPALLSEQEREWLLSLAQGATVAQLADAACYSERELYRRLGRLYRRLGAETRAEALVSAARAGILG